jgi:hypothetical protein
VQASLESISPSITLINTVYDYGIIRVITQRAGHKFKELKNILSISSGVITFQNFQK